ncbi:MAG: NTP transferase domain-containing protein [Gemmatimonadales bacterium]
MLAAGTSLRFGGHKLTADLGGTPLIVRVLAALEESRRRADLAGTLLVIRAGDRRFAELAGKDVELLELPPDEPAALAVSLRAGLASLEAPWRTPAPAAALLCLGDQPGLSPDVIEALVSAWRQGVAPVVRPRYAEATDVPGHPVLIDRSLWPLSAELSGDEGFGPLLARRPGLVQTIDVPGRNPDIDTPADLTEFRRELR